MGLSSALEGSHSAARPKVTHVILPNSFPLFFFFSFLTHSSPLITCFPASCGNVGPSCANLALPSRRFDQKEDIILWNRSQVFRGTQPLHVEHLTTFPDARARVGPYVRPARGKREALCESWWEAVEIAVEDWARAKDKGSGHGFRRGRSWRGTHRLNRSSSKT